MMCRRTCRLDEKTTRGIQQDGRDGAVFGRSPTMFSADLSTYSEIE